jgi:hypothetical protein
MIDAYGKRSQQATHRISQHSGPQTLKRSRQAKVANQHNLAAIIA